MARVSPEMVLAMWLENCVWLVLYCHSYRNKYMVMVIAYRVLVSQCAIVILCMAVNITVH